jgi:transposase-like protein
MPELPPDDVKRWTARRKAAVLTAVRSGAISVEEACRRYEISGEEFLAWLQAFETHGLPGLRTTRVQQYRRRRSSRARRRRS